MVVATERRQSGLMHRKIIDLPELMEHFEIHNRTEGKSPRTVEWYNLVLGQLCHWLESRDTPTTLDHADEMMIRRFILFLQEKPGTKAKTMSTHTMYNRVNALRSFFGWLHRQGYTDEHVLQNLKQPKTADLVIEPLNREEIDQIMRTINPKTALGARNTALVTIMLDTGLRISEVAGRTFTLGDSTSRPWERGPRSEWCPSVPPAGRPCSSTGNVIEVIQPTRRWKPSS